MKKEEKYSNFFGDTQNYKFHPPLPNPDGLRYNPDLSANSNDYGDGLNGTPDYRSFTGEVQDDAWSNHPGFISGLFGGGNNNNEPNTLSDGQVDANNNGVPDYLEVGPQPEPNTDQGGGGFISGLFGGGDGMKTYYTCQNGQVISGQYKRNQQPPGWGTSRRNACLTQQQIDERRANTWNNIGNFLTNLNKGFQSGLNRGGGTGTVGGNTQGGAPLSNTTTETTEAGMGGTTKIIGYVLIAGVVLGLGYMVIKAASAPQPEFMND